MAGKHFIFNPRDRRTRAVAAQLGIVMLVVAGLVWLGQTTAGNLADRGIAGGFGFLERAARFPIAESILSYRPTDSFGRAFLVGLGNTLFVALLVGFCATLFGLALALGRRSSHPLAYGLSTTLVEAMRNTPLVVQLLFWYAALTWGLPNIHAAIHPIEGVFLADRGLYLPRPVIVGGKETFLAVLLAGVVATIGAWWLGHQQRMATGRSYPLGRMMAAAGAGLALLVWLVTDLSIVLDKPVMGRFNITGGMGLSPEFTALFLGLLLYSAAFIGEIIRAGIDAVDRGQWEAGRALGLSEGKLLRLLVIPQALRVIIPPMTSQYINVTKNTTLALAVGYPDIALVTATTINQTGQAVEGIAVLMLVFLSISISASLFMNFYNRRIALVTR
jgi:general L-amino acid transport system permease protein